MCFVSTEREIGLSVGVEEISWLLCHKIDTSNIIVNYVLKSMLKKMKIHTDFYATKCYQKQMIFYTNLKHM